MNIFRRFRDAAVVAVLVAVPFFFLNSNLKHPENANWLDKLVLQASGPIQYVATVVARAVSEVVEEYVWVVDVHRENEVLAREGDRLKQELRELRAVSKENERLRRLLGLRDQGPRGNPSLRVLLDAPHLHTRFELRESGSTEGNVTWSVQVAVVNADGLVGEILRTAGRYGDVALRSTPTVRLMWS